MKIHNRPCTFGYKKRKSIQTNVKSVKRLKFEDPPTTPCSNHSVEDSTENLKWVTNGNFSLKSSHKDIIQNGEKLDCDIINFCQKLLSNKHPDIGGFQDTRYVPVRENGKWKYALPFKTVKDEMAAQVHRTGKDHWVTSIKMRNRNISVYDSCTGKMPSITDSMKIQLSKIYWQSDENAELRVNLPRVQQQNNAVDCGLFAIAFLTEFSTTKDDPKNCHFDVASMRSHLIDCINQKLMTPFPKKRSIIPPRRLSLSKGVNVAYEINCAGGCNLPDVFDDMSACDNCGKWFHQQCAGIQPVDSQRSFEWVCAVCSM